MNEAKELLIKHLKALPIGYDEAEMLQCLNDKKSEEGMLLNAMLNAVTEALNKHNVSNSLPADVDMWKQEYDGACREIISLQEQLKDAEREIADLNAELRDAHF